MNRQYATIIAKQSIDNLLNKSAEKLYDQYLLHKLPSHANTMQQHTFNTNFKITTIQTPSQLPIEMVSNRIIHNIPNDTLAPKRIIIKKYVDQYSTMSPNKSNLGKSTKYQTVIQSQNTLTDRVQGSQLMENKYFQEESFIQSSPQFRKSDRPMTMQVKRSRKNNNEESNIKEIPEKRAATCHVRKRKTVSLTTDPKTKPIKLQENIPGYIQDEMNQIHKIRIDKFHRAQQQNLYQSLNQQAKNNTQRLQRRRRQNYEEMKKEMQGKSTQVPQIFSFQSLNGEFVVNGKTKPQSKAHIIQLSFNPDEQSIASRVQSKNAKVNGISKTTFLSNKGQKKIKMTQEQFTNNNERQTSSIPFLALSYGVAIQQNILEVKASRQRPQELTRNKYKSIDVKDRFKSHNNYLNSARINLYETIQTNLTHNPQVAEIITKNPSERFLQTTMQTKTTMNNSILWRSNFQNNSQHNKIKISNKELLANELMEDNLSR